MVWILEAIDHPFKDMATIPQVKTLIMQGSHDRGGLAWHKRERSWCGRLMVRRYEIEETRP